MNLKQILNRNGENISKNRSTRLYNAGIRTSDDYLNDLQQQVDILEEKLEDLMDITASTDLNAGQVKLTSTEMSSIILKYHSTKEEYYLLTQRLKVAQKVNTELLEETS